MPSSTNIRTCCCIPYLQQTCLTAQNTLGVTSVAVTSPDVIRAQLEAVLSDIGTDALKTGMIPSVELASVRTYVRTDPNLNVAYCCGDNRNQNPFISYLMHRYRLIYGALSG